MTVIKSVINSTIYYGLIIDAIINEISFANMIYSNVAKMEYINIFKQKHPSTDYIVNSNK